MLKHLVLATLLGIAPALAQPAQPSIVGEWTAGDCAGSRIGYRLAPDGGLVAYLTNSAGSSDFAQPKFVSEDAQSLTIDFQDGSPPMVWKKGDQTIQPWQHGDAVKDGIRDGSPTPVFKRCR